MLDEIARALEQAARDRDPRRQGVLSQVRTQNDRRLRDEWEQQQRAAQFAAQQLVAQKKAAVHRQAMSARQAEAASVLAAEASRRARGASANAAAIAGWAKPTTLRSQFVLTEILKPPLSMRERH